MEREPTTGAADRGAGTAAGAAGKNENERERAPESEQETGRARQTRRGEAAGGAGAHRARGGEETAAAQLGTRGRTREGACPAWQVCAASAGRALGVSARLLKREHLGAHPDPHLHRWKPGALGAPRHPPQRPAVCYPSRSAPPAPSPGSPFSSLFPPCGCLLMDAPHTHRDVAGTPPDPKGRGQSTQPPGTHPEKYSKTQRRKGLRSSPPPCVSRTSTRWAASHIRRSSGVCPPVACSFAHATAPGTSI